MGKNGRVMIRRTLLRDIRMEIDEEEWDIRCSLSNSIVVDCCEPFVIENSCF